MWKCGATLALKCVCRHVRTYLVQSVWRCSCSLELCSHAFHCVRDFKTWPQAGIMSLLEIAAQHDSILKIMKWLRWWFIGSTFSCAHVGLMLQILSVALPRSCHFPQLRPALYHKCGQLSTSARSAYGTDLNYLWFYRGEVLNEERNQRRWEELNVKARVQVFCFGCFSVGALVLFSPCWSSSSLTSDQIWTRPGCKPYLFVFMTGRAIRDSPLCHAVFANSHSPALIYTSSIPGGPRRTLHPPALLQSPIWTCFFWTMSAFSLPHPNSLFVSLQLPVPSSSPPSPNPPFFPLS